MSFIAKNGEPLERIPSAYTGGMPGCGSFAVIFDSVTKRAIAGDEERRAQVALHDIPGPASVLHIPGVVQAHLLMQRRDALRVGAVPEDGNSHVPWNHPHDGKNEP